MKFITSVLVVASTIAMASARSNMQHFAKYSYPNNTQSATPTVATDASVPYSLLGPAIVSNPTAGSATGTSPPYSPTGYQSTNTTAISAAASGTGVSYHFTFRQPPNDSSYITATGPTASATGTGIASVPSGYSVHSNQRVHARDIGVEQHIGR